MLKSDKQQVHDFWNEAACGENLYLQKIDSEGYRAQEAERYRLEPFILPFADFSSTRSKKVLEIGVGLGADHQRFAEAGADLYGIDLTERAVEHTRRRLCLFGLSSKLFVGDAENLEFPSCFFDNVYSWGVLHHSPDTPKAIAEVYRVLKKGGTVVSISALPDFATARALNVNLALASVMGLASLPLAFRAWSHGGHYRYLFMRPDGDQLRLITPMLESGQIKPLIDKVYPLEQTREALAHVESGRARGKVVIAVG